MESFRIQKKYLVGLAQWLQRQNLAGLESRERTRFVGLLTEEVRKLDSDRLEIVSRFVEKEVNPETGETVWVKKTVDKGIEQFDIPEAKMLAFTKEITDLYDEEFILEITESRIKNMRVVSDIVLNSSYMFGPSELDSKEELERKVGEANDYEVWCRAFEGIGFED